jgi:hypothetical protein
LQGGEPQDYEDPILAQEIEEIAKRKKQAMIRENIKRRKNG